MDEIENIELLVGDETPPEFDHKPVDGEGGEPDDEMTAAEDLSAESYQADESDTKGLGGVCDHG